MLKLAFAGDTTSPFCSFLLFSDALEQFPRIKQSTHVNFSRSVTTKPRTIETSDGSKNTIKYKYDKLGRKTEETNGNGEKTKFTYSLAGKLLKETDALGNETTYEIEKQNMNNFITLKQNITLKYANGTCVVSNVES